MYRHTCISDTDESSFCTPCSVFFRDLAAAVAACFGGLAGSAAGQMHNNGGTASASPVSNGSGDVEGAGSSGNQAGSSVKETATSPASPVSDGCGGAKDELLY